MTMLLEFLEWHRARYLFRSSHLKEGRNSFFGLAVYLLKSTFRIEGKLRFP